MITSTKSLGALVGITKRAMQTEISRARKEGEEVPVIYVANAKGGADLMATDDEEKFIAWYRGRIARKMQNVKGNSNRILPHP